MAQMPHNPCFLVAVSAIIWAAHINNSFINGYTTTLMTRWQCHLQRSLSERWKVTIERSQAVEEGDIGGNAFDINNRGVFGK